MSNETLIKFYPKLIISSKLLEKSLNPKELAGSAGDILGLIVESTSHSELKKVK